MPAATYAIVWIEQEQARIIVFDGKSDGRLESNQGKVRLHRRSKPRSLLARRATDEHVFFQKIANDLADVGKFLVMATPEMNAQFVRHLRRYDHRLMANLSAIDATDGIADEDFLEIARVHFQRIQSSPPQSSAAMI